MGGYLVDKVVERQYGAGKVQRRVQRIRKVAQKAIVLIPRRMVDALPLRELPGLQRLLLHVRHQPLVIAVIVTAGAGAVRRHTARLFIAPPAVMVVPRWWGGGAGGGGCECTYLDSGATGGALLAALGGPVVVEVVGDEAQHRDVEAEAPARKQASAKGLVHCFADARALAGNEPGEDRGEAVAVAVLVGKEDGHIEDPCEYWVGNGGGVEERDEVVPCQDHQDLDDTKGVQGRQEDERKEDVENIAARDVVRGAVGASGGRGREGRVKDVVKDSAENRVQGEHAEQNRHVGAEGPELVVRVVDLAPGYPSR